MDSSSLISRFTFITLTDQMYIPAKKQDRCFQKKHVTRGIIINTKKKKN